MNIDEIVVKDRIRKDMGDIKELADDIKKNGLLNPITINTRRELIAGERRYRACKSLGMTDVPVHMVDLSTEEQMLKAEISENEVRKDFSMTERLYYTERISSIEKAKAKERQGTRNDLSNIPQNSAESGESRDKISEAVGMSHDTLRKAQTIEEHKDMIDPQDFADWDEGKLSTNKVFQKLKADLEESKSKNLKYYSEAEDAKQEVNKIQEQYNFASMEAERMSIKLRETEDKAQQYWKELQERPVKEVTKEVEVEPDDYEDLKRDNARLAAERKKFQEEAAEWEKKYKESGKTEVALDQQAKKDMDYLTAGIIEFLKNYSGHAWGIDRRASISDHYTADLKTQSMNLLAFAQNLYAIINESNEREK